MMFYVYVDYTHEPVPRPYYVGKGNIARVKKLQRNKKHTNVANRYGQHRIVLVETTDEQIAYQREIDFNRDLKTFYLDSKLGCNFTRGGEGGMTGRQRSELEKQTISEKLMGRKHTAEHIEKVRQANIGRKLSSEHRKNLSIAWHNASRIGPMVGRNHSDEVKLKMSQHRKGRAHPHKGRKLSPEHIQKLIQANRTRRANLHHHGKSNPRIFRDREVFCH